MKLPREVTIGVRDRIAKDLTITVRYSAPLRFRMWLASQAIRFAAWCIGGSADIGPEDS